MGGPRPNRRVQLSNSWDEFIESQMKKMLNGANAFATQWLRRLEDVYELRHDTDPDKGFVLLRVKVLEVHRIECCKLGFMSADIPEFLLRSIRILDFRTQIRTSKFSICNLLSTFST